MRKLVRRLWKDEAGFSLVEVMMSLVLTAILTATMVTWINSAGAAAALHRDDDVAVQDLRIAKERMTRELRMAQAVEEASMHRITVWVDEDDDDFPDAHEYITWSMASDGGLWRSTAASEGQLVISNLVYATSGFGFDNPSADEVSTITITLEASLPPDENGEASGTRLITTQVHLRNSS